MPVYLVTVYIEDTNPSTSLPDWEEKHVVDAESISHAEQAVRAHVAGRDQEAVVEVTSIAIVADQITAVNESTKPEPTL